MKKYACLGLLLGWGTLTAQFAPAGGAAPKSLEPVDWTNPILLQCGQAEAKLPSKILVHGTDKPTELPIELTETKEANLVFFDPKGREIFRTEIVVNYLPNEKNASQKFSKLYGSGWNGTYQGKPLPKGTYFYMVELEDLNKKTCRQSAKIELQ